ncbi:aspartate carbamoyltransferase regulatory subunit [Chryseobacterium vietnamense]|uniref:Aspartate carbamoyltransferase regulatory subunit n=1 Tax=Chryseobacterium vietnamense TaxID=866785 RepID=A0ACC6J912_9FLAO|nr:hypothetical protein [Chryseobacterium vietnamense]MDR6459262.1 aspartate carbamoyltransferase regulatory subunit [Chryseobacterium vietnamense]
MNIKELFTKTTTVNISVVKINNKNLTKSIFNQLNISSPFDRLYNLKNNVKFLGYVNDKTKWMIWTDEVNLFRFELKEFFTIRHLDLNRDTIDTLMKVYPSELVKKLYNYVDEEYHETYRNNQISTVLDLKEQYVILEKQKQVREIFENILERQILL